MKRADLYEHNDEIPLESQKNDDEKIGGPRSTRDSNIEGLTEA